MSRIDREKLQANLKNFPREAVAAIAARAAMRALPALGSDGGFRNWPEERRASHLQAVFLCYQASLFFAFREVKKNSDIWTATRAAARTARAAAYAAAAYAAADASAALAAAACAAAAAGYDAADAAAADAAHAAATDADAAYALEHDVTLARSGTPFLCGALWPQGTPSDFERRWRGFQNAARALGAGFEVWIDWYRDRLEGRPLDYEIEREWVLLSNVRRAQSPAEINAYLASLRTQAADQHLRRVRTIFIGHGGAGKTSLIKALRGEEVVAGEEAMTHGVAIHEMQEQAGVFTQITDMADDELTVHFWDFGGQVMAHATHQFFLRASCLYVIVIDARPERNANEEAEYWLENVRAFGDSAPVLIAGNKSDVAQVNLDLRSLKQKYSNIVDFYPVSCTEARGRFRTHFDRFSQDFRENLAALGERAERFTSAQFRVLKAVQAQAERDDFLKDSDFSELCWMNDVAMEGPGGRDSLLKFFDTLGIVMRFPTLPYLTDYVINPRWLTYGVYSIMYSDAARNAAGRLSEAALVDILKSAKPFDGKARPLLYPPERCQTIASAMVAFQVAYRLAHSFDGLVIPALLEPQQPEHDFKEDGALAFQFDFRGFLPRHVLPALIVDHHEDIATFGGRDIVWQNGVLLRPGRGNDAEALVKADYHERTINILVQGSDANAYLGILRDSVLRTLKTMPELRFDEKVMLHPEMRVDSDPLDILHSEPVWADYESVRTAQKRGMKEIAASKYVYDLAKVLRVMPMRPDIQPADVFLSYSNTDRAAADELAQRIEAAGYSVWYDRNLAGGQYFRDIIRQRIDAAKAVVVLWTENSVSRDWVCEEADRATGQKKLIPLCAPDLDRSKIPLPFGAIHPVDLGDAVKLNEALARLCRKR